MVARNDLLAIFSASTVMIFLPTVVRRSRRIHNFLQKAMYKLPADEFRNGLALAIEFQHKGNFFCVEGYKGFSLF